MISGFLVRVIVVIISTVFVGATWLATGAADVSFLRFFSAAVLSVSISLTIWDKWIWKYSIFQKLTKVTRDVSGTWETRLESFWVDPETGKRTPAKIVYIVVRQTSTQVSVSLLSNESKSQSSLARVVKENDSWILHYIYTNEPVTDFRHRSQIHHGSGVLEIVGNPANRIRGSYWTDRESKGTLSLGRRSGKFAEDYQGAAELFS